ncbi:MAG: MFS transporter [Oscillospiraceae bacterium]
MRKNKVKNPEAVGAKECIGVTALSTMGGVAAIFMSTMFMQYMTDYAGLGAWGASLATILLLVARLFDAVDDPIQGFIMDSGKVGKHGKYKPFFMISIIMTAVGTILLYALPDGITSSPVLVTVWVIFFYLVYDIGTSFNNGNLLYRTMTDDVNERAKLVIGPRVWVMIIGMLGSAMMMIIVAINSFTGSYKKSYAVVAAAASLIAALISVIGWFMVKEKHVVQQDEEEKVRVKDFFELFKVNKAMVVHFVKCIFSGFIWTLLFATPTYYVKWGFCTDLSTGQVDMALLGTYSLIVSMMMLLPLLLGSFIATPLMKLLKSPIRLTRLNLLLQAIGGGVLFVAQILGVLQSMPWLFFVGMFIMALAIGVDFVPQSTVEMEIMDYTIYKTGKDRSALSGVVNKFLEKAQTAVSSALVGAILIAIGYNVDSVTGDYAGDIANIPTMLNWFIVIMGLVPCILGIIAFIVYRFYPITNEVRADMRKYLEEHNKNAE